jgi:hypothetical protein
MIKRRQTDDAMWINPNSNLNGGHHIVWDRRKTDVGNARYLELADVALRPKKSEPQEADTSATKDTAE